MATSNPEPDLSATILEGSEGHFDYKCDPCHKGGYHYEARGYCQQCCEYLCDKCYDYHGKLTATQYHVLLDKTAMPTTKGTQNVRDVLIKTCPKHTDKVLEYVCNVHDKLCCSVCLNLDHVTCTDRSYIPDISASIIDSEEYKHLQTDLQKLVSMATDRKMEMTAAEKQNDKFRNNALERLHYLRQQIDEMLDRIETEIKQDIYRLNRENNNKINTASNYYKAILSEISGISSNIERKSKSGKTDQLYVDAKLSIPRASEIKEKLQSMEHWNMSCYEMKATDVQKMESTLSALIALSVEQDSPVTKATYIRDVNVKSQGDDKDCGINGVAVLDKDRVVVTDSINKAVKLIDGKKNQIITSVKLTSGPFDVTETEPDQVAVARQGRKIELFSVSDTLSSLKVLHVPNDEVVGLCYNGEMLIAACIDPGSVKIIDMSGDIIKRFDIKHGTSDVSTPTHIAINRDHTVVYVTDSKSNNVTTMDMDGRIISMYKNDELKFPEGVTVGRYGEVFVCSLTIHQLSPTGQFTRILLDNKHDLAVIPKAITYNNHDNKLYVSCICQRKNAIIVFKLKKENDFIFENL